MGIRKKFLSIFIFALFAASGFARAGPADILNSSLLPAAPLYDKASAPSRHEALGLINTDYFSSKAPAFRSGAENSENSVKAQIADTWSWSTHWQAAAIGSDEYRSGENYNYLDVRELSMSYQDGGQRLTLGRHLDSWSAWDERWRQGVFEARYLENRLRSQSAGLAGAFYSLGDSRAQLTVGVMPVFIPDFGPHFDVQENHFESKNPWFSVPASSFVYRGQSSDIHYAIDQPATQSVISHPGAAAKYERQENTNLRSRVSFAYKPLPQFALGFPSDHQVVVANQSDYMNVVIQPRLIYDRVVNFDQMFSLAGWSCAASVAYDHPEDNPGPDTLTAQQFTSATIFAFSTSHKLEAEGPRAARFEFAFLKVNGGDAPDRGRFAGATALFERRFQYYEAYSLAVKTQLRSWFHNPVQTEARVLYDRMQGGGVISLSSGVNIDEHWRADVDLDFIGLLTANAQIQDGFLDNYRANDRLGLGVSYVF